MDLIKMPRERCVHIIDDEVRVREALTVLLSTAGIESRCYGSAEEYLKSMQLPEPVCVLLDNQLPGMSGNLASLYPPWRLISMPRGGCCSLALPASG